MAFAARRGGNSQGGNGQSGSRRGRGGGSGRSGNNQVATLRARGSVISHGSDTANAGTGAAPQIPGAGTAMIAQAGAQNTQQAGTAQLQLDPTYDAKVNRWSDMDEDDAN